VGKGTGVGLPKTWAHDALVSKIWPGPPRAPPRLNLSLHSINSVHGLYKYSSLYVDDTRKFAWMGLLRTVWSDAFPCPTSHHCQCVEQSVCVGCVWSGVSVPACTWSVWVHALTYCASSSKYLPVPACARSGYCLPEFACAWSRYCLPEFACVWSCYCLPVPACAWSVISSSAISSFPYHKNMVLLNININSPCVAM